jgi:hypothetical protein
VIPTIVCVAILVRLWGRGEVYGTHLGVLVAWFAVALTIEIAGPTIWWWLLGFLAQVALAIVLAFKQQLGEMW